MKCDKFMIVIVIIIMIWLEKFYIWFFEKSGDISVIFKVNFDVKFFLSCYIDF